MALRPWIENLALALKKVCRNLLFLNVFLNLIERLIRLQDANSLLNWDNVAARLKAR